MKQPSSSRQVNRLHQHQTHHTSGWMEMEMHHDLLWIGAAKDPGQTLLCCFFFLNLGKFRSQPIFLFGGVVSVERWNDNLFSTNMSDFRWWFQAFVCGSTQYLRKIYSFLMHRIVFFLEMGEPSRVLWQNREVMIGDCFGECVSMFVMHLLDIHAAIVPPKTNNMWCVYCRYIYLDPPRGTKFIRVWVPFGKPGVCTQSSVYIYIDLYIHALYT